MCYHCLGLPGRLQAGRLLLNSTHLSRGILRISIVMSIIIIIMWELYLTQTDLHVTFCSRLSANLSLWSSISQWLETNWLVMTVSEWWRPTAGQIETLRRIQLTIGKSTIVYLIRKPRDPRDLGGPWTLSTLVKWLLRHCQEVIQVQPWSNRTVFIPD